MPTKNKILSFFVYFLNFASAYAYVDSNGLITVLDRGQPGAFEIQDLPRVRTQDSLGVCYASAASTLIDFAVCSDNRLSCANLSDDLRTAPLDIARFTTDDPNNSREREKYNGIKEGGNLVGTLRNVFRTNGPIVTEQCAPFDQVVAKNTDPLRRQEMELALWKRLNDLYKTNKDLDQECEKCKLETSTALDEIRKDFDLKSSNEVILKALAEKSYENFLDKILVGDCVEDFGIMSVPNRKVQTFPSKDLSPSSPEKNYSEMIDQIKNVLKEKKVPLGLSFCAQDGALTYKTLKDCSGGEIVESEKSDKKGALHAVVITGYRRVCKNGTNDCYDALKIQNSWGQQWQDEHNDGWMDARELMKRTFYSASTLTWLEQDKK